MKLSSLTARVALVLSLAAVAGCKDGTGSGSDAAGQYNVVAGMVDPGSGQLQRQVLPGVLYSGAVVDDNNNTYNIRYELLSSSITLVERGRTYTFVGSYRATETNNRLSPYNETITETGTYRVSGSNILFTQSATSEIWIDGDGTFANGKISVEVTDPLFGEDNVYEFQR